MFNLNNLICYIIFNDNEYFYEYSKFGSWFIIVLIW